MCKGSKGLLTKIVEVMKKEPTASTFRFWLARAVESYLRGSTSYCDQIFLLRKGLLQVLLQNIWDYSAVNCLCDSSINFCVLIYIFAQHIAANIVEHDLRPKEILQSSFDLLGELIKFNGEAFRAFDKVLNSKQRVSLPPTCLPLVHLTNRLKRIRPTSVLKLKHFIFQLEKFLAVINKNLVDSNMFIRALILSLEHFSNVQEEHKGKKNKRVLRDQC